MNIIKKQKKCGARCPQHAFTMRPIRNDTFLKQDTHILYCPKLVLQYSNNQNLFPQFNRDGKPHTPAFIISIDKNYYEENDEKFLNDHNRKARDYLQKKQIVPFYLNVIQFVPKPNRKNKYCSVCRNNYDDYLEHIKFSSHKKCINSSKYNAHILQLCDLLFKNINEKQVIVIEDKQSIHTSENVEKKNSFPSTQYERKPFKKRKIQKKSNFNQPNNNNNNVQILNIIPSQRAYDPNQFNPWNNPNNAFINPPFAHQSFYQNKFPYPPFPNGHPYNHFNSFQHFQNLNYLNNFNGCNIYNHNYFDPKNSLENTFMKPQSSKLKSNNIIIIDDQD